VNPYFDQKQKSKQEILASLIEEERSKREQYSRQAIQQHAEKIDILLKQRKLDKIENSKLLTR
jgi:hypothetical protein